MSDRILNDKNIFPDDNVLLDVLGNSKKTWDSFNELLKSDYPLIATEWRYYNDGKSWLFKVTQKTKTICWVSVWQKYFKVTFYFNRKAKEIIKNSMLDKSIKNQWLKNEKINNIAPITIEVKKKNDLSTIKDLIDLKSSIK